MNWTPYIAIWSFFALIVIGLAVYRKMLAVQEDDSLHVSEGTARLISEQAANARTHRSHREMGQEPDRSRRVRRL